MSAFDGPTGAPSAALTPADRSTEFVAVQGGSDGTSAETLLVAAYLVMWAILLLFLFFTWRKQGRIESRLSELDAQIRRQQKS